jgi:hypothetical protein
VGDRGTIALIECRSFFLRDNFDVSPNEDEILGSFINLDRLNSLQLEVLNHLLHLFLLEIPDAVSYVVFLDEHLVALEDVLLPELLFELWESLEHFEHERFLDLNYLGHSVGSGLRVIDVSKQALKAEDLTGKHRLLVDEALVSEFNYNTTLLHKEEVFGDFRIVYDSFVCIERILLSHLFGYQL